MGQVLAEQEEEVAEEEDGGRCFEVRAVEVDWGLLEAEARKRHSVESHWLKGQEFGRKTLSRQKVGRSSWPGLPHGGRWSGGHYELLLATDHAHPGEGGGGAHPAVPAQHTGVQPLIAPGSSVFLIF